MLTSIKSNTLMLAVLAVLAAAPARAEDLMQIYQQARAADPSLAIADATKNAVAENVPEARAALLPQLSASLGYLHDDGGSKSVFAQPDQAGNLALFPETVTTRDRSR